MTDWLTAAQVQAQLGVRAQTLYAYVSRGRIEARADDADPRKSLYSAADVARLAVRKLRGRRAALVAEDAIAWGEPVLASAITTVSHGRLYYRGQDVALLAQTQTLEQTAALLRGDEVVRSKPGPTAPGSLAGASVNVRTRAFAALAIRAVADAPAWGRARGVLAAEAAGLLDVLTDAVAGQAGGGAIHARLAAAWGQDEAGADLIRRSLVLLADHELNASTFAARVAASTGASLAACALAGLSTLSGPLHGGMAARVEAFVGEAQRLGGEAAVAGRLGQGAVVPGFGHPLYPAGDPRAQALLAAFEPPPLFRAINEAAQATTGQPPNIDFALTALAAARGFPPDAAFLLFAIGRCAGWLAHALEQAGGGQLIRPRARYIGAPPQ